MDPTSDSTSSASPAWWQNTIDFVVRTAATAKLQQSMLQPNQMYQTDANGNVVPMGQPNRYLMPGAATGAAVTSNPLMLVAGVALIGLLVFKLVK